MAKRYHQSKKARHAEHMGMEKYERGPVKHQEHYAGMNTRRRQEMEDAGMIHEDHNAVANLPQNVIYRPYPGYGAGLPEGLDDTIRGVDAQMEMDDKKRMEHFAPKKV